MAKQGRAGQALTISALAWFVAGTFSVVMLMVAAPPIARWALKFGPPEYFALMLLGLTCVSGLMGDNKLKGYMMAFLGLMLSADRLRHDRRRAALPPSACSSSPTASSSCPWRSACSASPKC